MKLVNRLSNLSKYAVVASFLALEVFAFIAFSFGNSFLLFGILSFALLFVVLLFSFKEIKSDGFTKYALFLFPLFIYVLLTGLGIYSKAHIQLGDFSTAEVVFVPIGILSIALCAYILSLNKTFKLKYFLIVIYAALTLLVFINLMSNIVNFGAFHTLKYKNYYMYYGGQRSEVSLSNMAYALQGFRFIEVQLSYYNMFPLLLLSSSFVFINLKYKEHKKTYLSYLLFNVIALLSLILVPSKIGLIYIALVAVIDLVIILWNRYKSIHKPLTIILKIFIALMGIGLFLVILNNQSFAGKFSSFIKNNAFLNKLFNTNSFMQSYNPMVYNIFCSDRFLGFYNIFLASAVESLGTLTGNWLFDNFMTSGVIGNAAFIFLIVVGLKRFAKYKTEDKESWAIKNTLLVFSLIFLIYTFLSYNGEYGIFYSIVRPFYMTAPFMIFIFILSYVFAKGCVEVKQDEKIA